MAPKNRNVARGLQEIGTMLMQYKQQVDQQKQREFENTFKTAMLQQKADEDARKNLLFGAIGQNPTNNQVVGTAPMLSPRSGAPLGAAYDAGMYQQHQVPADILRNMQRDVVGLPQMPDRMASSPFAERTKQYYNTAETMNEGLIPPKGLNPLELINLEIKKEQLKTLRNPADKASGKFIDPNKRTADIRNFVYKNTENKKVFPMAVKALDEFGTLTVPQNPEGWKPTEYLQLMREKLALDNMFPMSSYMTSKETEEPKDPMREQLKSEGYTDEEIDAVMGQ
jgi:hypothetical protein